MMARLIQALLVLLALFHCHNTANTPTASSIHKIPLRLTNNYRYYASISMGSTSQPM